MRLAELAPGKGFVVSRVLSGGEIGKRLADMGFTDGTEGVVVRAAFMRGPIQVRIRGYDLLVRRGEAAMIEVAAEGGAEARAAADGAGWGFRRRRGARGGQASRGADAFAGGPRIERGAGRWNALRAMFGQPDCCRPPRRRWGGGKA